ncbi:hypothetical protein C8R44DRAFT_755489 [Mycena epipterygia]|nr:hypothetical protein C8R44DRAFT_755489 [Mycena epipterygia]
MPLSDIPADVLMEITGHLDLSDSLQLVATCSTCRTLLRSRYFWIVALNRMEHFHRRPLPSSPGTDITSLSLATLQKLAIHAYKLKKNWASASPRTVSVRRLVTERHLSKFSPIEASHLFLTLSATRFACWDTVSGECIAALEHPEGYMVRMSDPHVALGKCLVGIVYHSYSPEAMMMEIAVLQIDYHEPVATVSKVFSKSWTAPDLASHLVSNVAVNEELIAVVLLARSYGTSFLLFCGFDNTTIHRIPLVADKIATTPQSLIHGDDIYFGRQGLLDPFAEVGRIRTSAVPNDLKMVTKKLDIPFPVHALEQNTFFGTSNLRCPKYGIVNVTSRSSLRHPAGDDEIHILHFWPVEVTKSPLEGIDVQPPCFYEHSSRIVSLGVGASGTCAVIIDDANTIGLVQYIAHPTTQTTFRPLRLPEAEVDRHTKIALDDRLGIIYVQRPTQKDTFTIISYA